MNDELLKRIAHHLYSSVNLFYPNDPVSDDLLLAVGKAFNRYYHNENIREEDRLLLISAECHDPGYFNRGHACEACIRTGITFNDRVTDIMATALLRELQTNGVDIAELAERKKHADDDQLDVLIIEMNKLLQQYYPLPTLESLSAKVAIQNKEKWRHTEKPQMIANNLFAKYPELEVDPERLVANQLDVFLLKYKPQALEAQVLISLILLVKESKNLYKDIHTLLTKTKYKDYAAYMRQYVSAPLIEIMKVNIDKPEDMKRAVSEFVSKYKPKSVETYYLKRLLDIAKSSDKSVHLERLVADKTLTKKMNERLLVTLRKPIQDIIEAKNKLAAEQGPPR